MAKVPEFKALNAAVLTVSDTRTPANDTSGNVIVERLEQAGHHVRLRKIQIDELQLLRNDFQQLIDDPEVDLIIATGGTGLTQRDVTPEAATGFFDKQIPGFGELFRMLSYEEIDSSTIESRACAGVAGGTLVFVLPGSPGACRTAMDKIIVKQIDIRTRPCNLTELLPRIRGEAS